jgi:hypothetical protein
MGNSTLCGHLDEKDADDGDEEEDEEDDGFRWLFWFSVSLLLEAV